MGKKLTYEEVKEYIESFGYKLLETKYINSKTKMRIQCDKGHVYISHFNNFKNGCRCPECKRLNYVKIAKTSYKEVKNFIESIGYKLLSKEYNRNTEKLDIECDKGHKIKMTYKSLKKGHRCVKCAKEKQSKRQSLSYDEVKSYIESLGYKLLSKEYKNSYIKLKMQCDKGHVFYMAYNNFRNGQRCSICRYDKASESQRLSYEEVKQYIESFDYKLLSKEYINSRKLLKVQCDKGHICSVSFSNFKSGYRCPICNKSHGEKNIEDILEKYNIEYVPQKRFKDCKFKRSLPFDFYLPGYNVCVEFDGRQHYEIIDAFDGLNGFIDTKIRDTVKNIYCEDKNIKLIRIPYWNINEIEDILCNELLINQE